MKNSNFIVRIPEPCHEDWNKMQPDEKGKFCGSCSKSVFDFSTKTDTEIKSILLEHKDQKVCGHFKKTQIDRPLNIKIDFNNLPKNISTTKAFAIALFLVFGTLLFSCTDDKDQTVGTIAIENTIPKQTDHKSEEFTVGSLVALPIATVEPIQNIETLDGEIMIQETFVNGGIGYYEVPTQNLPEIVGKVEAYDTTKCEKVPEQPNPENHIRGLIMANPINEDTTTIKSDSVNKETLQKIADETVITKQTNLVIYPNPTNGEFTIKYDVVKRADVSLTIYDIKGTLVKTIVNVAGQYEGKYKIPVNLNELTAGIYIVNLINNGKRFTEKLVIEN